MTFKSQMLALPLRHKIAAVTAALGIAYCSMTAARLAPIARRTEAFQPQPQMREGAAPESKEETLLRITLAMLDTRFKDLDAQRQSIENERGSTAGGHAGAASEDRSSLAQVELAAAQTNAGREPDRRPVPAKTAKIDRQMTAMRAQRALLVNRLQEAQHERASGEALAIRRTNVDVRGALRNPLSPGLMSTLAGVLGGSLYLAAALRRYRPIRGAAALHRVLPGEIPLIGSIPEVSR